MLANFHPLLPDIPENCPRARVGTKRGRKKIVTIPSSTRRSRNFPAARSRNFTIPRNRRVAKLLWRKFHGTSHRGLNFHNESRIRLAFITARFISCRSRKGTRSIFDVISTFLPRSVLFCGCAPRVPRQTSLH